MSLNRGEVNALNALGFRKLSFIPNHFSKITIDHKFDTRIVEQWIEYNLNSRYAIRVIHKLDSNKKIVSVTEIGLEDPSELTLLTIGCQELYTK
jgi:hypothetical protein